LPAPDDFSIRGQREYLAPRGPVEELISELWSEVLKVDQVGINDNFFDLGGHSLLLSQVAARIKVAFSVDMPLRALFDAPTISQLAVAIAAEQMKAAEFNEAARTLEEIQRLSDNEIRLLLESEKTSNSVRQG
jgi:acyl carrier protein